MRECDGCGGELTGRQQRFCSVACRQRGSRRDRQGAAVEQVSDGASESPLSAAPGLVARTRRELEDKGRLDTVPGALTLRLAELLESPFTQGVAGIAREFREARAEALAGVKAAADPVDEVKERRESKRRAAAGDA